MFSTALFALAAPVSVTDYLIWIVVIAAGIALMYIALRKFGVRIPEWAYQVFWIVVICFAVITAIRFVAAM